MLVNKAFGQSDSSLPVRGPDSAWTLQDAYLANLKDVDDAPPTKKQALVWMPPADQPESEELMWRPTTLTLSTLKDVSITSPVDGDVLHYVNSVWTNGPESGARNTSTTLSELTGVSIVDPQAGDLLCFDYLAQAVTNTSSPSAASYLNLGTYVYLTKSSTVPLMQILPNYPIAVMTNFSYDVCKVSNAALDPSAANRVSTTYLKDIGWSVLNFTFERLPRIVDISAADTPGFIAAIVVNCDVQEGTRLTIIREANTDDPSSGFPLCIADAFSPSYPDEVDLTGSVLPFTTGATIPSDIFRKYGMMRFATSCTVETFVCPRTVGDQTMQSLAVVGSTSIIEYVPIVHAMVSLSSNVQKNELTFEDSNVTDGGFVFLFDYQSGGLFLSDDITGHFLVCVNYDARDIAELAVNDTIVQLDSGWNPFTLTGGAKLCLKITGGNSVGYKFSIQPDLTGL